MDTTSYSDYSKFDPYLFDPRNYYKYGKNKYASKGVHKGMQGWICDERNIENGWLVNFPQYGEKDDIATIAKYSLQGTTQGRYLTGGVPPVRFSM